MSARRRLHRYTDLRQLRLRQEEMKAQVYASAVRGVQLAEQAKHTLEERRRAMILEGRVESGGAIDAELLRRVQQYERHLARAIVEQDAVIHERTAVAKTKHSELNESVKLRKMMEALLDGARSEVADKITRQDRIDTDEIASMRAAAKLKPEV